MDIIKYNTIFYVCPYVAISIVSWLLGINLTVLSMPLYLIINIVNFTRQSFFCVEMTSLVANKVAKQPAKSATIDMISTVATVSFFQVAIYGLEWLINVILPSTLYLSSICSFPMLVIYHSFYCHNALWQTHGFEVSRRIDIHEKVWPYYMGYGFTGSILFLGSGNHLTMAIYNVYMIILVIIPFYNAPRFPRKNIIYPEIKLSIVSYIIKKGMTIVKYLINKLFI